MTRKYYHGTEFKYDKPKLNRDGIFWLAPNRKVALLYGGADRTVGNTYVWEVTLKPNTVIVDLSDLTNPIVRDMRDWLEPNHEDDPFPDEMWDADWHKVPGFKRLEEPQAKKWLRARKVDAVRCTDAWNRSGIPHDSIALLNLRKIQTIEKLVEPNGQVPRIQETENGRFRNWDESDLEKINKWLREAAARVAARFASDPRKGEPDLLAPRVLAQYIRATVGGERHTEAASKARTAGLHSSSFSNWDRKKQLEALKRQRETISEGIGHWDDFGVAKNALWFVEGVPGWSYTLESEPYTSKYGAGTYDVDVLVVQAPNHKTFRAVENGDRRPDCAVWLRDETNYLDALDAKAAEIRASMRAEAQKKKQGRPVPVGYGTCPCCFGAYKLRKSGGKILMVIHGYERPGIGYIQGRCYGHDYSPFEISKEGTERWLGVLEGTLKLVTEQLKRSKKSLKEPRHKIKVIELNHNIIPDPETGGFKETKDVYTPEHPQWDKALESREAHLLNDIDSTENKITAIKRDIKELQSRIAKWNPVEGFEASVRPR